MARHGRRSIVRANPGRRRASVLVFVVALLGLLFIAGAAFLRSVTFEAQSIAIESKVLAGESLIDTLEAQVFAALERSWLGPEGPYTILDSNVLLYDDPANSTFNDFIVGPTYGELGGLSPLIASIEPFLNTSGQLEFDYVSQLDQMVASEATLQNDPAQSPLQAPVIPQNLPPGSADADGDGVSDSWAVSLVSTPLTPGTTFLVEAFIPQHILDPVVEQLNLPGSVAPLQLGLRILSNSGMVNLNYSHPFLVKNALVDDALDPTDGSGQVNLVNAPYEPRMEESTLRSHFILPPQVLPSSVLHGRPNDDDNLGDLSLLLFPQTGDPDETNESYRWWAFDSLTNSDVVASGTWYDRMDSEEMNPAVWYDRRHLGTTISSDDLFIRSDLITTTNAPLGIDPGTGFPVANGLDWMGVILSEYDNSQTAWDLFQSQYDLDVLHNMQPGTSGGIYGTDYAYDAYPAGLPINDPRKGRVQLSLDWIENQLLSYDSAGVPLASPLGIDHINAYPTALESIAAVRLIGDAFTLMLRNHLGSGSLVTVDIPLTAASLTANLIDYADEDDEPTPIAVRGFFGPPNILDGFADSRVVYGLERQPYITELFTMIVDDPGLPGEDDIDPSASVSAIELYNPYLSPGSPASDLDLSLYDLVIDGTVYPLPLITLKPGDFVVFWNGILDPSAPTSSVPLGTLGQWVLTANSTVDLVLRAGVLPANVVVDRFVASAASVNFGQTPYPSSPDAGDSLERDTSVTFAGTGGSWRLTVPVALERTAHSMDGPTNATRFNSHIDPTIRPVQADFANSGSLTSAFPTTGSLWLLMRHANTDASTVNVPFTERLATANTALNPAGNESAEIDNGRMPVFDVAESYHSSASTPGLPFATQIVDGLNALPWGQYIFDYFTALPLDDPAGPMPLSPKVEEFGARVHGRININTAPWKVLEGLPLIPGADLPGPFATQMSITVDLNNGPGNGAELWIGPQLAMAIVAYRELRFYSPTNGTTGDYGSIGTLDSRAIGDTGAMLRRGRGFLTVGELLEIRHSLVVNDTTIFGGGSALAGDQITLWRMDSGVVGRLENDGLTPANQDFVSAIALMVSLGDWVTTRSHVFTVYGTVAGDAATNNEIRFQETVDRLPGLLDGTGPERIGERIVEE